MNNNSPYSFLLISVIGLMMISGFSIGQDRDINSPQKTVIYRVAEYPDNPELLKASLTLPAPTKDENTVLSLRGTQLNIKPQVINVRCRDNALSLNEKGQWILPEGCREITWQIELAAVEPFSIEIARQQSVLVKSDPSWILLSEFSFLPRLESGDYSAVIEFSRDLEEKLVSFLDRDRKNRRIISGGNGPIFLVFGLETVTHDSPSGITLSYLADDKESGREINSFYPSHLQSIEYIHSLFSYPEDREFNFNVIWLGLNREGGLGGAAGNRSFLINYPRENGRLLKDKFIWAMMTAFHEQFHVLYYGTGASQPTWANESLAQYYALKSLGKAGFPTSITRPVRERFLNPERKIKTGLAEANRRFESDNDFSVYHLFYDQGSTFWFQLDNLISKSTSGEKDLDDFIGLFSKMVFPEDGTLPAEFLELLESNGVENIHNLCEKYL